MGQFLTKNGKLGDEDLVSVYGKGNQFTKDQLSNSNVFAINDHRDLITSMNTVFPNQNPYYRARSFTMTTNLGSVDVFNHSTSHELPDISFENTHWTGLPEVFFEAAAKDLLATKERLFPYAKILESVN